MTNNPIIETRGLVKHFPLKGSGIFGRQYGTVHALNGVDVTVAEGETLAIVGESGCGKSTLAKTLALLYKPTEGWLWFKGDSLLNLSAADRAAVRRQIQLIFQDPYGSLNPRLTAGEVIAEPLIIHKIGNKSERLDQVEAAAVAVGLKSDDMERYPHQFSGGQRQRIAIARAIIADPVLIIADEPLSALDVSIQSQILNLLLELREARGHSLIFISHDLAVVRHLADRVAVMYLGRIVEVGSAESIFVNPQHPYSRALIAAVPRPGAGKRRSRNVLAGDVPSPMRLPHGCVFQSRCPKVQEICGTEAPDLEIKTTKRGEHLAACHFPEDS